MTANGGNVTPDNLVKYPEQKAMRPPRFRLIPFNEIALSTTPAYLIKGLIPRSGLVVIWGPPKCGKSFWTFDATMHIALGWPYRGRKVRQGAVVYFVLEGDAGFKARVEAFRQRFLTEEVDGTIPFYDVPARLDLVADRKELIASIRVQLGPVVPAAVVIDTLNRSLSGSESSDEDMAKYVKAADTIRDAFDCAVIIVHHCGINESRPRGHTSLTGAADAQIAITRDPANNIVATVEWLKDGSEGDTIVSRLESIEVGIDDDGDGISSCVVVPADALPASARTKAHSMPKAAQTALRALVEALDERGEQPLPTAYIPTGVKVVTTSQWREQAYRRGISTSDEKRAKEMAFKRAGEHLIGIGKVGVWDGQVWIV